MANISFEWNLHYRNVLMPNTVFLCLELIAGVAGNLLVLFVYIFKMKNVLEDRYFIPVLAVLDIVASLVSTIFYMSDSINWVAYPSSGLCKFFFFMTTMSSGASAHILLIIALQRYLKICRPTGRQMTLFWKRISVGVVIVLSFIYAVPLLYYTDTQGVEWVHGGQNVTGIMCIMAANATGGSEFYYFATLFVILIANVIATVAMYGPICYVIYKRFATRKRNQMQRPDSAMPGDIKIDDSFQETSKSTETSDIHTVESTKATEKTTKENTEKKKSSRAKKVKTNFNHMFFAIVIFYVMSYIPTFVFIFIVRIIDDFWLNLSDAQLGICVFLARLFILNHIANPIIYGYFDIKFRSEVRKLGCPGYTRAAQYQIRKD